MTTELWIVLMSALGAVAGSVISCVAWRLPQILQREALAESCLPPGLPSEYKNGSMPVNLFFPGSLCPRCQQRLAFYHNIPLLSWLLLCGRCHYCQQPISWHYLLTELAATITGGWIAFNWSPGGTALLFALCGWWLILLSAIDLRCLLLPDCLTLSLLWLGLLVNLHHTIIPLNDAVAGAAAGYLILWAVNRVFRLISGKEGLGHGDFKLLAALGAWCGWQPLPWLLLLAALMGCTVYLLLWLAGRRRYAQPLPFGPCLALSGWWILTTPVAML